MLWKLRHPRLCVETNIPVSKLVKHGLGTHGQHLRKQDSWPCGGNHKREQVSKKHALGFSTKRSTLLDSSVTTTPYLDGSSTCTVQAFREGKRVC